MKLSHRIAFAMILMAATLTFNANTLVEARYDSETKGAPASAAAEIQVTIMSYNVHLFGDLNNDLVKEIANSKEKVSYQDKLRTEELIKKLLASDADIVVLQEMWDQSLARRIKEGVKSKFPNGWRPGKDPSFDLWEAMTERDVSKITKVLGSGLMILARGNYRIYDKDFDEYDDLQDVDKLARKGYSKVLCSTNVNGKLVGFALIVTHAQTGANQNYDVVRKGAIKLRTKAMNVRKNNPGFPVIVAGDFNIKAEEPNGTQTSVYKSLLIQEFGEAQLEDAWRVLFKNVSQAPGLTVDAQNTFAKNMLGKAEENNKRIDYIFFNRKSLDGTTNVIPQSITVIKDYKYNDPDKKSANDLSDHYPVKATFAIQVR